MTTKKNKSKNLYPKDILEPVRRFLKENLHNLKHFEKDLKNEDPFADDSRIDDNASPDSDAAEQFGHARTFAIREELTRKMKQTRKALSMIKLGTYGVCEDCSDMIDTDRLMVYPEANFCAKCQKKREK